MVWGQVIHSLAYYDVSNRNVIVVFLVADRSFKIVSRRLTDDI